LISAGLKISEYNKIINDRLPIIEKWKIVEPFWLASENTGYGRVLQICAKDLYGIETIEASTIEALNEKFIDSLKPGHFKKVLRDKSKIKTSLLNVNTFKRQYSITEKKWSIYCDKNFFNPVYWINVFIYPSLWEQIEDIEQQSGEKITSFKKWLEVTEYMIDKAYSLGAVALKNPLAYVRTLKYERVSRDTAENEFNEIFKTKHYPDFQGRPISVKKNFQDYMFHFILDIANKKKLIMQIHTGIQEGNGNLLNNSRPELLSNLFLEYPNVIFDIFHIGYPFQNELTVLAKNYHNVFIDMCWSHVVSPNASVNALVEWVDTVPLNKIFAFGGDYIFIDGVYGHQYIARQNVAKALSIVVEQGIMTIEKAMEVSEMLFYSNPLRIFKLEIE
jgi:predicted TIM-barrel fold metal-dependent hydrolase